jgi:hypothetical protein
MTLMLDLPVETEQRLTEEARRRGMNVADYALKLIEEAVPCGCDPVTIEQLDSLLDEVAEGGTELPVLPAERLDSRAFYYEDVP